MENWTLRPLASACLAWLALTGVVYLIIYVASRRTENGWLAGQSLLATVYPLWLLGLEIPTDLLALLIGCACLASVGFTRAHFALRGPGRSWWMVFAVPGVTGALHHVGWVSTRAVSAVLVVVVALTIAHQLVLLWRTTALNGRVLHAAWAVLAVAFVVELATGDRTTIVALTLHALLYTVALAREHGRSIEEAERQRHELASRFATIEIKSREIDSLNEELRRQIGLRSRQLAHALTAATAGPSGLAIGSEIAGRYRVLGHLGTGGMGCVYEVARGTDGRRFALKLLHGYANPAVLARFAREAEILARLHHPNLVEIVDVDASEHGQLFIVMELVDGASLVPATPPDVATCIRVLTEVAAGLAAIHAAGIVHRDLKPANILMSRDGKAIKIADFGVSSFARFATEDSHADLTEAGAIIGTPTYMAPELVSGMHTAGFAVDIFSFGVFAYELLSGQSPFSGGAVAVRLRGDAETAPPSLAELVPGLPRDLVELIAACLAWFPAERPVAASMLERLHAMPAAEILILPPRARRPTAPTRAYAVAVDGICATVEQRESERHVAN